MKNKILFTLTLLLGIFFSFTSVDALTKINFEETANGKINTTLHFEEGFVGGIDITFNVAGDVEVKEFQFSNKITSGNYEKSAKYDKNTHTLTVRVTTGGIGTSHNLLNDKKELALGTMVFTTDAKENVDYKLSETAFKIVDNNWDSKTIEQSHITLGDKTAFVYEVSPSTTNPPEEKDPNENTGSGEEDKPGSDDENQSTTPSDSEEENNENSTETNNSSSNSGNNVTDNSSDNNGSSDDNTTDNQENNDDKEVVKDEEKTEKDSDTKKNKFDWYFVVVALIIFFIGVLMYFLLVLKKKNKNTEE